MKHRCSQIVRRVAEWQFALLYSTTTILALQYDATIAFGQSSDVSDFVPAEMTWSQIPSSERIGVLELLCKSAKGNYQRIRTLNVTYDVVQTERLAEDYVIATFGEHLRKGEQKEILQQVEFVTNVVLDMSKDQIYRDKKSRRIGHTLADSGRQVTLPGAPFDERSIVNSKEFTHFAPQHVWTPQEVARFPEAKRKPAAFRDPLETAIRTQKGDFLDPRRFFALSGDKQVWEVYGVFVDVLKGGRGDERAQYEQAISIDEAAHGSAKWYRVRVKLANEFVAVIWSPEAGYNPISYVLSSDKDGRLPIAYTFWEWRSVDGVFVPWNVQETTCLARNGLMNYQRQARVLACNVNAPVKATQFEYAALGLNDGNLVVDNIERVVYIVKGGALTRLAAFGEK